MRAKAPHQARIVSGNDESAAPFDERIDTRFDFLAEARALRKWPMVRLWKTLTGR